jgi:hypothetical protein
MKKGIAMILETVKVLARFKLKPFFSVVDSAPVAAADNDVDEDDDDDDDDAAYDGFDNGPPYS